MLEWNSLATFMLLALAGSLHCAGMCGGFAALVALRARSASPSMFVYVLGKAVSYSILGLSLALLTGGVERGLHRSATPELAHGFQSVLALLFGLALIVAGLAALGVRVPQRLAAVPKPIRRLFAATRELPGLQGAFGVGLLTGLLPCGLSWSAFAIAASSTPATAAVGLFLFGLGTAPALFAVGLFGAQIPLRVRRLGRWLVGPLLIALGCVTLLRGGLPGAEEVLPSCCSEQPLAPN